jgi:predicted HTH domain antitoxin
MSITFQLPLELEQKLRAETPNIEAEAKEAYALELFRRRKLSHSELSKLLGLDKLQTDSYLNRHHVLEGSLTMADLEEQTQTLDRVLGPVRR